MSSLKDSKEKEHLNKIAISQGIKYKDSSICQQWSDLVKLYLTHGKLIENDGRTIVFDVGGHKVEIWTSNFGYAFGKPWNTPPFDGDERPERYVGYALKLYIDSLTTNFVDDIYKEVYDDKL